MAEFTGPGPRRPLGELRREHLAFYKVRDGDSQGRRFGGIVSRPGFLFLHLGFNRFSEEETAVDESAMLVETPSELWLRTFYFDASKTRIVPDEVMFPKDATAHRIFDGGETPWVAYAGEAGVFVYRLRRDGYVDERDWSGDFERDRRLYGELVFEVERPRKTFVGVDTSDAGQHGNALLIHVEGDVYVYVGGEIYAFRSSEAIVAFFSRTGASGATYPVAASSDDVFFLLERQAVKRRDLEPHVASAFTWDDAYTVLYARRDLPKAPLAGLKCIAERLD